MFTIFKRTRVCFAESILFNIPEEAISLGSGILNRCAKYVSFGVYRLPDCETELYKMLCE